MIKKAFLTSLLAALIGFWWLPLAAQSSSPEAMASQAPMLTTASPVATIGPSSYLQGNWKVERAIFELFGNLKEVTASDERFYDLLNLGQNGKGTLRYGLKTSDIEIEYELKNNQNLTIALGSRLKPMVDLYQILMLADGSLYMRSTRLSGVNGTVYYFLRKANP